RDASRVQFASVDLTKVVYDLAQPNSRIRPVVEVTQPLDAVLLATGDCVQIAFHGGGEVVINELGKVLLKQPNHTKRHPSRHKRLATLGRITAIKHGVDDARKSRGASDPLFFQ